MQTTVSYPASSGDIMKGFKPGRDRVQPWAIPGLHREGGLISSVELRALPFTTHKPCLHKGMRKSAHISWTEVKEKWVLSKENNSNAKRKQRKGG